jgi:translation initiation factor IF-2
MTEDRDFKKVVRERSAKTGESYQAARRQIEGKQGLSARVSGVFRPADADGLALGCIVDEGRLTVGTPVTLMAGETIIHTGTVASLRRGKDDQDAVASGECGVTFDPPLVHFYELPDLLVG